MNTIRQNIPNAVTALNLVCGCIAINFLFPDTMGYDNWVYASYFILAAAGFDFIDGFVARALKVHSEMGKQLDSLCDVVSFGVAPSFLLMKMIEKADQWSLMPFSSSITKYLALLVAIFSAVRLARFNIDTRQKNHFIGLPVPANAMLIVSLPLIIEFGDGRYDFIMLSPWFLFPLIFLSSYLLVAPLPLIALKFKEYSLQNNKPRYLLIASGVVFTLLFGFFAIPLTIGTYIVLSIVFRKEIQ